MSLSNEYIISKKHYSGFFNTNLHDLLQKLKIDTIVVVGVYINLCVFHTVADAYQWGYKVVVPQDATNSFKASDYRVFLQYFAQNYAVEVTTTAKVIKGI